MKLRITTCLLAMSAMLAAASGASAQDKPKLMTLGLDDATATKSLTDSATKTGQANQLARLTDSLNQHLIASFQNTRKFELVARADMAKLIAEQNIPIGVIRAPDGRGAPGQIKGLDRMLIVTITDFADQSVGLNIEGAGQRVDRRTVQATAMFKIYDATTGSLMQAIPINDLKESKGVGRVAAGVQANNAPNDAMIEEVATDLAARGAQKVLGLLFPARVVSVLGDQVTLNRGQNTEIAEGQIWEIFAQGEELKDPDTGASLGREEVKVGEVVVESVTTLVSRTKIQGENRGIATGAVARLRTAAAAPGAGPAAR